MHRGHLGAIERAFVWFESVLEWPMIDVRYDLTARDVNIIHVTAQLYLLISVNHSHCQSIVLMSSHSSSCRALPGLRQCKAP